MELHVLYDKSGTILAGAPSDAGTTRSGGDRTPGPRPVAGRGQLTATVQVPEEFRSQNLVDICAQLVVDTRARQAVLKPRPKGGTRSSAKRARGK